MFKIFALLSFSLLLPIGAQAQPEVKDPWVSVTLPPFMYEFSDLDTCVFTECLEILDAAAKAATGKEGNTIYVIPKSMLNEQPANFELLRDASGAPVSDDGPFVFARVTTAYFIKTVKMGVEDPRGLSLLMKNFKSRFALALTSPDFLAHHSSARASLMLQRLLRFRSDPLAEKKIRAAIYTAILNRTDPYARVEPVEGVHETSFGIGVEFDWFNGSIFVIGVRAHSRADKDGVVVGDRLLSVNDIPMTTQAFIDVISKLGELSSSHVSLKFQDPSGKIKSVSWDLKTTDDLDSSSFTYVASGKKIGVVRIYTFESKTICAQTESHLKNLVAEQVDAILVDFRNNGGGYLDQSACVVGLFVGPNKTILRRTVLKEGLRYDHYKDSAEAFSKGVLTDKQKVTGTIPLVTLINAESASAGELTPTYMREKGGIWVVGQRSYGKGIVQTGVEMSVGKNLVLYTTTSRLDFDDGSSLHTHGLKPDFEVSSALKGQDGERMASRFSDDHGKAFATDKRPPALPRWRAFEKLKVSRCLRGGMSDRLQTGVQAGRWLQDQQLRLATAVALCELAGK